MGRTTAAVVEEVLAELDPTAAGAAPASTLPMLVDVLATSSYGGDRDGVHVASRSAPSNPRRPDAGLLR
jgi:hypothetical protein